MGLREETAAEFPRAHPFGPKDGFIPFRIASVHAVLGKTTDALEALSTAQVRGYFIRSEQRSSEFDFLRGLREIRQAKCRSWGAGSSAELSGAQQMQ